MELNRMYLIPLVPDEVNISVTLIDANHCPGAVMFLFEGYFGTVLYTGDFRYSALMLETYPLVERPLIDVLYMDNTYCDPLCSFPKREVAKQQIIDIIKEHEKCCVRVMLVMRSLGKEHLLEDLAEYFDTCIIVDGKSYDQLKVLDRKNVFSTNANDGFIHTVLNINSKLIHRLQLEMPTIAIWPTALFTGLNAQPFCRNDDVFIVPYSDHSSYSELSDFVRFIKPKKIVPVVSASTHGPMGCDVSQRANMNCFHHLMSKELMPEVTVPHAVHLWMQGVQVPHKLQYRCS